MGVLRSLSQIRVGSLWMRSLPSSMQSQRQSTGSPVLIIPRYYNSYHVTLLDFTVRPSLFHFYFIYNRQTGWLKGLTKPYHDVWQRLLMKISSTGMISSTQSWWGTGRHSRHPRSSHHTICYSSSKWGCQLMPRSCHNLRRMMGKTTALRVYDSLNTALPLDTKKQIAAILHSPEEEIKREYANVQGNTYVVIIVRQ